jgi:hypothetical protein
MLHGAVNTHHKVEKSNRPNRDIWPDELPEAAAAPSYHIEIKGKNPMVVSDGTGPQRKRYSNATVI